MTGSVMLGHLMGQAAVGKLSRAFIWRRTFQRLEGQGCNRLPCKRHGGGKAHYPVRRRGDVPRPIPPPTTSRLNTRRSYSCIRTAKTVERSTYARLETEGLSTPFRT